MKRFLPLLAALLLASSGAWAQPISQTIKFPLRAGLGGTGLSTVPLNELLLGNGTNPLSSLAPGPDGNCVVSSTGIWLSVPCPGGSTAGVSTFNTRAGAVTLTGSDVSSAGGLLSTNNLADVSSVITARANLGLGTAAVQPSTAFLLPGNNLADVTNAVTSRTNLGLGSASVKNATGVSTTVASVNGAFTVNDCMKAADVAGSLVTAGGPCVTGLAVSSFNTRTGAVTLTSGDISTVGALLASNNLIDLVNVVTARNNLGLGLAATKNVTGGGSLVAVPQGVFTVDHCLSVADVNGSPKDAGGPCSGTSGVTSFNTRTGAIVSIGTDISSAGGLLASNNLSDIVSASAARTSLGLGTVATLNTASVLLSANNLSDLSSAPSARTNLGLGTASTQATTTFAQTANNLSDLLSAATARTNLGLVAIASSGSASDLTAGTVAAARLPLPTLTTIGAVKAIDCSAGSQVIQKINTDGSETCVSPSGAIPAGVAQQVIAYAVTGSVVAPFTMGPNFAIDTSAKTINFSLPVNSRATSCTVATGNTGCLGSTSGDMGGTVNFTSTATLTIPAISSTLFANQQGMCYEISSGTLTIASTPTIIGIPSTTVPAGGGGCLVSNGTNLTWEPGRAGDELRTANNLSELTGTAATARTNLGLVTVASSGSASDLTIGTLAAARLPNPTASTLGGVESIALISHNFLTSISTSGVPAQSQPACSDLTGVAPSCSTDTTNATNITSGTLAAARIAATPLTASTSITLTSPRGYAVCTGTCTVTVPVPAAGSEYCAMNDDNVATVITLAALGSSARYEATSRTTYGTAGSGTFVSGGAIGDKVCIVGRDTTHFLTLSFTGTWVAN